VDTQELTDSEQTLSAEAQELHAAAEGMQAAIEALLFVASEALDPKRIAKLTGEDERAVALALQALEERYSRGGIVLRQIAGGYRRKRRFQRRRSRRWQSSRTCSR